MPDLQKPLNGTRILYSVLNWGLGHATRSSVLIRALIERGAEVHIASDGDALKVLSKQFPDAIAHELPSYKIRYSKNGASLFSLLLQASSSLKVMGREFEAVKKLHRMHQFDGIISDNRPASWIGGIPSVYLSHQIRLKAGKLSRILTKQHHRMYCKFSEVWIPDMADRQLSGELSKVPRKGPRFRYIGWLSRLEPKEELRNKDWAVVLSGPEPARSEWEKQIMQEHSEWPGEGVIVRGKPGGQASESAAIIDYLDAEGLSNLYARTHVIIARSGYSTLMDLAVAGKRAILVPTPGQPEQEYLGEHLRERDGWQVLKQGEEIGKTLKTLISKDDPAKELIELPEDLFRLFEGE